MTTADQAVTYLRWKKEVDVHDFADGYHRVSLAYALDPYADVPLKLA
jgi:hypothetical protein